ncbi:MAG TPA: tetratricopeptide repeat protein [Chthoniobacterales bacterium]
MKRSLPLASICAALAFTSQILAADQDPSDLFLKAYMAIQTAEKLEANGKTGDALKQYKFAGGLLDQIRSNSPNWQPLVIEYRSKKTSQRIADLQAQASRDNDFSSAPSTGTIEPELPTDILPPVPTDLASATPAGANDSSTQDSPPTAKPSGSELEELRRQLSENRLEIARLRQQNQTLTRKNDQAARNLQQALQRADQNRIQVAELRSQLAQAEDRLQAASTNRRTAERDLESARVTIAKLRTQIDERIADVDLVEDEAADLTGKIVATNQSASKATAERDAALKEKNAAVQARDEALADLEKAKNDQGSSSQLIAKANTERDEAVKARDEALASVEKAKVDQEKAAKLLTDNASLNTQLANAEKRLTDLANRPTAKEVAQLKKQILDVRSQFSGARDQIFSGEKAVADLKKQLAAQTAATDKAVAEAQKSGARPEEIVKIQDENTLLRNIVLRSLQDQIKRNQAGQVLLEELAKVEGKSQTLLDQVDVLGNISLKLNDKERDLFTDSELSYFDSGSKTSRLSVELKQKTTPTATAAEAASKAASTGIPTPTPAISEVPSLEAQAAKKIPQAQAAFEAGDLSKAERLYSEVLELQPENLDALSGLGIVFYRQKNYTYAEEVLQKAIAVGPKDYTSRCTLGIVYYHQGKWDAATRILRESLALDPNNPTAYNYLGISASKKGQSEQAVKDLQKAIALNPKYATAYFNLAVVYATARPPALKSARENYQKATSLGARPDPLLEKLIQ